MSALAPTSFDLTDRDAVRQLMSNQRHHMRQLDSGMKNLGAIYMIIKDFIGLFFVTKWVTLTKDKVRNSFYQERFYNDQKDLSSKIIFHHCSSSYFLKQYEVFLIQFVAYIQQSSAFHLDCFQISIKYDFSSFKLRYCFGLAIFHQNLGISQKTASWFNSCTTIISPRVKRTPFPGTIISATIKTSLTIAITIAISFSRTTFIIISTATISSPTFTTCSCSSCSCSQSV